MAQPKTLTHSQVEVLRWIKQGCPAGIYEDFGHRITAGALRRRGLADTSGKGSTWTAKITMEGRAYLKRVDGPNPPKLRGEPERAQASKLHGLAMGVHLAGGALRVPAVSYQSRNRVDWAARARTAEKHGFFPAGTWLVVLHHPGEAELRLEAAPERLLLDGRPVPVAVPQVIRRFHPVARAFRDRRERHEVSDEHLRRAVGIVHAIATEAERRGWEVQASTESADKYGRTSWSAARDGHLKLTTPLREFTFRLSEGGVRTRGAWDEQVAYNRRYPPSERWSVGRSDRSVPTGRFDAEANGRFKLELSAEHRWDFSGRRSRWNDSESRPLEVLLSAVFWEIEGRLVLLAREDELARRQAAVAAERARAAAVLREKEWWQHVLAAQQAWLEAQRRDQLRELAAHQHDIALMRNLCAELRQRHEGEPDAATYLEWAESYLDANDPLQQPPVLVSERTKLVAELEPFMPKGWSAAGPDEKPRPERQTSGHAPTSTEEFSLGLSSNRHPWRSHWAARR